MRSRWGRFATILSALVVVAAALPVQAAIAAQPANDHFADRQPLAGLPVEFDATNEEATKEDGEAFPIPFAAGHSVWFEWEAPSSGMVTVGACNENFDALLGIFTGTAIGALTPVVSGNDDEGPYFCDGSGGVYSFLATAGTEYVIAADGNGFFLPDWPEKPPTEGDFTLRIEATPPPENDDFEDAALLAGEISEEPDGERFYFASAPGYNWGATEEPGEPDHRGDPGGASVWYTWTAPESGIARIGTCCGGPPLLGIYTGGSVGGLDPVDATFTFSGVELPVAAGAVYRIAIDGKHEAGAAATGSFFIRASMNLPPLSKDQPQTPNPESTPQPSDLAPPDTRVTGRTIRHHRRSVTFAFSSTEAGTFRCRLDRGRYRPCRSPRTYSNLALGRHVFEVVAVDVAGNQDPKPATVRFVVAETGRTKGR